VIGIGGGASVEATDICENRGLSVPPLPKKVVAELRTFTPLAGSSVRNPVDTIEAWNPPEFAKTIELVGSCPTIDCMIIHLSVESAINRQGGKELFDQIVNVLLTTGKNVGKLMAVVFRSTGTEDGFSIINDAHKVCLNGRIPVFPSVERAALAISRFVGYHELQFP
ncbi:MAG: hypothetical protein SVW57_15575, partial [Thermodesulfobacteriota bacterium]|nr:hypothetical protein [Thermodesulfobacteriota bacterium]